MTDFLVESVVNGTLEGAEGGDLSKDLQQVYRDEEALFSRPSIMTRVAIAAIAAVGTAAYYQTEPNRIAIKGVYALFAAGIGVNVGMLGGDSRIDAAATAASYYALTMASGRISGRDQWSIYESGAILASGAAYDAYLRSQSAQDAKQAKQGKHKRKSDKSE
jgi:hypothetical protein